MQTRLLTHIFAQLVDDIGGGEAAQAAIEASLKHSISSATISKMRKGTAEPSAIFISILEDATGNYPFTDMRARSKEARQSAMKVADPVTHVELLKEFMEASIASAEHEADDDCPEKVAAAYAEMAEAVEIGQRALAQLGQKINRNATPAPTQLSNRRASA